MLVQVKEGIIKLKKKTNKPNPLRDKNCLVHCQKKNNSLSKTKMIERRQKTTEVHDERIISAKKTTSQHLSKS